MTKAERAEAHQKIRDAAAARKQQVADLSTAVDTLTKRIEELENQDVRKELEEALTALQEARDELVEADAQLQTTLDAVTAE